MTDDGAIRVETGAQPGLRLLVVEDSVDDFDLLVRVLRKAGVEPQATRVESETGLRAALSDSDWDAAVVDHVIPGYGGPQALQLLRALAPDLAVVVVSGKVDEEVIAADLRLGADDYVFKSSLSRLVPAIEQARQAAAGRRDRRRAEEALRASEARYRRMVDQASEGVWAMDRDHVTTFVNERMAQMLGVEPADMLGRPVEDFVFPEDLDDHGRQMAARHTGRSSRYERRFRHRDGREVLTMVAATPVRDADGEFDGSFAMFTDITDRVRVERDLAAQRDLLSTVFDSAPYAVMVLDDELRVREANRALRESIARSDHHEDLTDLLCGEAIDCAADPETQCGDGVACPRCSVRSLVVRTLETGESSLDVEGRLTLRRNGTVEEADVLLSAAPVLVGGESLCLVTMADVTERSRAARALRESEARYRRVVEGTSEGLLELDADYRILAVNDRWLEMMGYGRTDVLGREVHDFLFEEDLPDLEANIERRRKGIAGRHERRFRRADGAELWAVISAVPKTASDGTFEGVVALWLDITTQKAAQRTVADQERYYRSLIHSLHEDVLVIDHDYRVTDINNMALHTLGVSREDAIGRRCHEISHHADSPCHEHGQRCGLREVFAAGEPVNCHHVHRSTDGSVVHVDVLIAPLRDEDGTITHVIEAARDVTDLFAAQEELSEHAERLRRTVEGAVDAMGSVVEMRDPYTAGHERRVTCLAVEIAQRLGLDERRVEGLRLAGSVHDIGKIAVPAEILSKPGRLQEYEMNLVRTHAQVGHDVLAAIDFEQPVADIVLQHHEKLDGSGYPGGLHGDEILLEARILTVADVVEAMSSHRPYRAALGMSAALAEIREGAGSRYDAAVVAACEEAIAGGFTFDPGR